MTDRSAGEGRGDDDLYVITLCTASLPMVLRVPFVHELVGFSVFRSRTVQDGRERFRLYVGYFDSATRAHEALAVVRRHYPGAWISCAPRQNLGSLDDTMNTAFRMIRRATARLIEPADVLRSPATNEALATAAGPEAWQAPADAPPQRYVVQLDWSTTPVPSAAIPQLALLRAYNLYRAQLTREDGLHHALRLGFFKNVHGARQVAEYVRVRFPRVGVVPISHREYKRALELFERRTAAAAAATTPAATTPAAPRHLLPATAWMDEQPTAAARMTPAVQGAAAPVQRSRAQLLALLGANELEVDENARAHSTRDAAGGSPPPRVPRNIRSW